MKEGRRRAPPPPPPPRSAMPADALAERANDLPQHLDDVRWHRLDVLRCHCRLEDRNRLLRRPLRVPVVEIPPRPLRVTPLRYVERNAAPRLFNCRARSGSFRSSSVTTGTNRRTTSTATS